MYLNLILLLVVAVVFAFQFNAGLWSNLLTFINMVSAALLSSTTFEYFSDWLEKKAPDYTNVWDFCMLWGLFALYMVIFRSITDTVSRVKVRFRKPIDPIGAVLFALLSGWVMVCFTLFTLHTAPLARNFFNGEFQPEPTSEMFFGLSPDVLWLGFLHKQSLGPLGRREFDPQGEFIFKYAQRRQDIDTSPGNSVLTRNKK